MQHRRVLVISTLAAFTVGPSIAPVVERFTCAEERELRVASRSRKQRPDEHVDPELHGEMGFLDFTVPSITGGGVGGSFVRLAAELRRPKENL
jgi:hypothetical protein